MEGADLPGRNPTIRTLSACITPSRKPWPNPMKTSMWWKTERVENYLITYHFSGPDWWSVLVYPKALISREAHQGRPAGARARPVHILVVLRGYILGGA